MKSRPLAVEGALAFTPDVHHDHRGLFVSTFYEPAYLEATGRPLFGVAQASLSRSRRGVVRGVHYSGAVPGTAKYVTCPHGRILDIVVDLRVGSPTFGEWDAVELDGRGFQATYLPPGAGHAFVALEDDSVMSYLLSASYVAAHERAVSVLDPALGLPVPDDIDPVLSERDRAAPTLAAAEAAGLLPVYDPAQEH